MYSVFYNECSQCGLMSAYFQGTARTDQAKQLEHIARQHVSHDYTVTVEEMFEPAMHSFNKAFDELETNHV